MWHSSYNNTGSYKLLVHSRDINCPVLRNYRLSVYAVGPILCKYYANTVWSSQQTRDKNEMNRALGHLCAHIGQTGPGEPPEDGEMIEMTLFSRHRIRNSSPGGLRPSTLPLGHGGYPQYWLSHVDVGETFCVSFNRRDRDNLPRTLAWKAAVLTTTLGPPPNKHETRRERLWISYDGNCVVSVILKWRDIIVEITPSPL